MKKKYNEDENLASKRNEDWWRLEKFQIGRKRFPQNAHFAQYSLKQEICDAFTGTLLRTK